MLKCPYSLLAHGALSERRYEMNTLLIVSPFPASPNYRYSAGDALASV
jgi:hypothetical protein